MADALASMGIRRGDRVATVLPNGLPAIVSFLAASVAGTAAPLNPGYREDEFSFYLEDTGAKILLCTARWRGCCAQSRRQQSGIPVYSLETERYRIRAHRRSARRKDSRAPASPDDIALVLHTSGSTGRPKRVPILHRNITASTQNIVAHYCSDAGGRLALRHAAVPRAWTGGLHAFHAAFRRHRGGARQVQSAFLLAHRARHRRHLVFGGAHHSQPSALARRQRAAGGRRGFALHPLLQRVAAARNDGARWSESFGAPVLEAYGMTEASHQMARIRSRRARASPARWDRAPASNRHHGRRRQSACRGRTRRSRDPRSQRGRRLREQSRSQREILHQRLVPHRRSGLSRCGRLSDADRPHQGTDQSRRRKDRAARNRRSSADASRGGRSGGFRRAAPDLGRRSRGRRCAEREATCYRSRDLWRSARSGWPISSVRRSSTSSRPSRAPRPAKSSAARSRKRSRAER